MRQATDARREDLRQRLIDIAEVRIAADGLAGLKARALAAEAGCSVGAIYTAFDDLTGLAMAVNGRTFQRLGACVVARVSDDAPALSQLVEIARGYLHFAIETPRLWRALFEVQMPAEGEIPPWYLAELGKLFAIIATPLAQANPGLPQRDVALLTRALFSSVHGIVFLGLEGRISAVPRADLERMVDITVTRIARSLNS